MNLFARTVLENTSLESATPNKSMTLEHTGA